MGTILNITYCSGIVLTGWTPVGLPAPPRMPLGPPPKTTIAPPAVPPESATVTKDYNAEVDETQTSMPDILFKSAYRQYSYQAYYKHSGRRPTRNNPAFIIFTLTEIHTDAAPWRKVDQIFLVYGKRQRAYEVELYNVDEWMKNNSLTWLTRRQSHFYRETLYLDISVHDYQQITASKSFTIQIGNKDYVFQGKYLRPLRKLATTLNFR